MPDSSIIGTDKLTVEAGVWVELGSTEEVDVCAGALAFCLLFWEDKLSVFSSVLLDVPWMGCIV